MDLKDMRNGFRDLLYAYVSYQACRRQSYKDSFNPGFYRPLSHLRFSTLAQMLVNPFITQNSTTYLSPTVFPSLIPRQTQHPSAITLSRCSHILLHRGFHGSSFSHSDCQPARTGTYDASHPKRVESAWTGYA